MEDPEDRRKAHEIVHEEEVKGCENMKLREDLHEFISCLRKSRVRLALSTRNSEYALEYFMQSARLPPTTFHPSLHRDSLGKINKPDPAVSRFCIDTWDDSLHNSINDENQNGGHVWFLGDSIDDMTSGKGSGCKTCLLKTEFNKGLENNKELVDVAVDSLKEWLDHVEMRR
jgi:phosphoglycolate phosphatase-like HAD superfamily hydrolase